jgi:hypothetical protein
MAIGARVGLRIVYLPEQGKEARLRFCLTCSGTPVYVVREKQKKSEKI